MQSEEELEVRTVEVAVAVATKASYKLRYRRAHRAGEPNRVVVKCNADSNSDNKHNSGRSRTLTVFGVVFLAEQSRTKFTGVSACHMYFLVL